MEAEVPLSAPTPIAPADNTDHQNMVALSSGATSVESPTSLRMASGEKTKARELLDAIRTLKRVESEGREATQGEKQLMSRFSGFGPVALSIFPDPVTGDYKDKQWANIGSELELLLSPHEYGSAKRTTFNAFYSSPEVIQAIHQGVRQLGVGDQSTYLEPGCGVGNFMSHGPATARFIGVEMDSISGRIAKAIHQNHDIRIENFRDTKLATNAVDCVVGNVPFADVKLDYRGSKLSLHDYFFAKSLEALRPGGVLALVTTHFTMDKQNAFVRELLGSKADFVGAIRLPSDAFKREGTSVVTDIVFLRKRAEGEPAKHVDDSWLTSTPMRLCDASIPVNNYFQHHPEMVLGTWSRKDTLYGGEGYSIQANGDLREQLEGALKRLPTFAAKRGGADRIRDSVFAIPQDEPHLTEGSFFIGKDRAIFQVVGGQGEKVVYGGRALTADGAMTGKRLAALLELRDRARKVLRSQNESWPTDLRDTLRNELNRAYDRFCIAYGPINKTTFSETADGNVIRRMPNLAKFREDPDAMLVMSLEDYDDTTGKARKAAIMERDVVGKTNEVTSVQTAEDGLLVSLNQKGCVDLEYIASLYGRGEHQVIAELGDLIYRNPLTEQWETADVYLSGDVRQKLKVARTAGEAFFRNANALERVLPEDVLPGEIDANLGSPWIPTTDVAQFASELLQVPQCAITIGHLKKDAIWNVSGNYEAQQCVGATSDFGTRRANGLGLLEQALNMKSPIIYDTVRTTDGEERVVNEAETLAAKEKQKLIKERFKAWVFTNTNRTDRLVRIYNDTYNNIRPRLFDGSHLSFPGMCDAITLRPHQNDAVWRCMSSGNTLLAHTVGAGKTFTMAAAGMKMKQAGLVKKPMFVVPNHLLEQFAREFMQLYPNAKLLIAAKEDLTKGKRKFLTAKIASNNWDGVIVTHSSFERIGMSNEFQATFLRQQIKQYEELLKEHASQSESNRNIRKNLEKQKVAREERLHELLAKDKKDDGLVFDELGVDHVFIDEAHYFKNLETPTKMERVAGLQTSGSERAFDIFMKARYLGEHNPGHGVTFATGTPISNTMVEMYTMQRFLDPEGLASRGIEHFDAWAATFGEVVESMEITPDGSGLRPRSRFARFTNLPELQQMFRAFTDVQTPEMLNLPRPVLMDGKPIIIASSMSPDQQELQEALVKRYENIRSQKIDPRMDNALAITTDGRKLATDARMLSASAPDFLESKINKLVDQVVKVWHASASGKGTQLIFSDLGINPTPWGFSTYQDIVNKLIERGIPKEQIATMGDADNDSKKQVLFEKVRNGNVRVLLGSTQKMGTGTNVQKRLVALHHLDAPWKPAEVEQRDGRILRQGNENKEVAIYRYVTSGSFDAYMWQALETKAKFIGQVITGSNASRKLEDIGDQELSFAEVKAIASGNPAVLTLAQADAELHRLNMLRKYHHDEQYLARTRVRDLPDKIAMLKTRYEKLQEDTATVEASHERGLVLGGYRVPPDEWTKMVGDALDRLPITTDNYQKLSMGDYKGLRFGLILHRDSAREVFLEGKLLHCERLGCEHQGPRAVLNALERLCRELPEATRQTKEELALSEKQLQDYASKLNQPFTYDSYRAELDRLRGLLKSKLTANVATADTESAEDLAEQIKQLSSVSQVDFGCEPSHRKETVAAEAVTTSIKRRREFQEEQEPSAEVAINTHTDRAVQGMHSVTEITGV